MSEALYELKTEELDNYRCEFCDEHLRKRFIDLKEYLYKIYRLFIQINKSNKFKEDVKTFADELEDIKNRYFTIRALIYKIIEIKKHLNENRNSLNGLKVYHDSNTVTENDRKEINNLLLLKKSKLMEYKDKVIEFERLLKKLEELLESVSFNLPNI